MSNDNTAAPDDHADDIRRWLTIGNSVALGVVLFVMTVATLLILDLRSSVAALEDEARRSAKAAKALQAELDGVKEKLRLARAADAAPIRPSNIDAADTKRDCVVRPGDQQGVAGCLKLPGQE